MASCNAGEDRNSEEPTNGAHPLSQKEAGPSWGTNNDGGIPIHEIILRSYLGVLQFMVALLPIRKPVLFPQAPALRLYSQMKFWYDILLTSIYEISSS